MVAQQGQGGIHLSCCEAWLGQLVAAMLRRVLIEDVLWAHMGKNAGCLPPSGLHAWSYN